MSRILTKEELDEWKSHPVTREVMKGIRNNYEDIKNQWSSGTYNSDDPMITHTANISALSQLRALEQLMDIDYEKLVTMLEK